MNFLLADTDNKMPQFVRANDEIVSIANGNHAKIDAWFVPIPVDQSDPHDLPKFAPRPVLSDDKTQQPSTDVAPKENPQFTTTHEPRQVAPMWTPIPSSYHEAMTRKWCNKKKSTMTPEEQSRLVISHSVFNGSFYYNAGRMATLSVPEEYIEAFYYHVATDVIQGHCIALDERQPINANTRANLFFDFDFVLDSSSCLDANGDSTFCFWQLTPIVRLVQYVISELFEDNSDEQNGAQYLCVATTSSHLRVRRDGVKLGMHIHFPRLRLPTTRLADVVRIVTLECARRFPEESTEIGSLITVAQQGDNPSEVRIRGRWTHIIDLNVVKQSSLSLRLLHAHKLEQCTCGDETSCPHWRSACTPRRFHSPVVHVIRGIIGHKARVLDNYTNRLTRPLDLSTWEVKDCRAALLLCSVLYDHLQPPPRFIVDWSDVPDLHKWYDALVNAGYRNASTDDVANDDPNEGPAVFEDFDVPEKSVWVDPLSTLTKDDIAVLLADYVRIRIPDCKILKITSMKNPKVTKNVKQNMKYLVYFKSPGPCPFGRRHKRVRSYFLFTRNTVSLRCTSPKESPVLMNLLNCNDLQGMVEHTPLVMKKKIFHLDCVQGASLPIQLPPIEIPNKYYLGITDNDESVQQATKLIALFYLQLGPYLRRPKQFLDFYERYCEKIGFEKSNLC